MACCTVVIFSASSSGISVSNSSSSAITSSTVSSESAPRSSTNDDSFLISASLAPSCSATIFFTRCSTFSILLLPLRACRIETEDFTRTGHPRSPLSEASPLCHVHSPVDVQCDAGDIARLLRGEKKHGVRDVLRRAEPPQRYLFEQCSTLRFRQRLRHIGIDEARRHAVDRDVATADFLRERFRESDERRLGRRVVGLAGVFTPAAPPAQPTEWFG